MCDSRSISSFVFILLLLFLGSFRYTQIVHVFSLIFSIREHTMTVFALIRVYRTWTLSLSFSLSPFFPFLFFSVRIQFTPYTPEFGLLNAFIYVRVKWIFLYFMSLIPDERNFSFFLFLIVCVCRLFATFVCLRLVIIIVSGVRNISALNHKHIQA